MSTLKRIVERFESEDKQAGNQSFDARRSSLAWAMYSDAKEGLREEIKIQESLRWALQAIYQMAHNPAQASPSWVKSEQYKDAESLLGIDR